MKRKVILATLILLTTCTLGVGLCSCGKGKDAVDLEPATSVERQEETQTEQTDNEQEVSEEVSSEENTSEEIASETAEDQSLTDVKVPGMEDSKYDKASYFADRVYAANKGSNVLVSPLSLDMALGMASEGAKGDTKEELLAYLDTEDYGKKAESYMQFLESLTGSEKKSNAKKLNEKIKNSLNLDAGEGSSSYSEYYEIANSVWANDQMKLKDSFKDRVTDLYHAEVDNVDFGDGKEQTVDRINDWCKEKTHEMIPQIITPSDVDESLATVLVNALYFESAWVDNWGVRQDTFTDLQGKETETDMLVDTLNTYYENDQATAFSKYYMNGMEFIGILPKNEGDFNLADLDLESLLASKDRGTYDVYAKMPKLNYDSSYDQIVEMLAEMGVHTAFDENNADFSEMMELTEDQKVYISKIIQKCKIELDEEGTKAAAVTSIMMKANSAMPEQKEIKEVYLDRPFAYLIYDSAHDEILFAGKVVK